MKLLVVCLALVACEVTWANTRDQAMLKRLLNAMERPDTKRANEKRYLNQLTHHPSVDPRYPRAMWVELQMDVDVMEACRDCVLFVAFQCVSPNCRDTQVQFFPPHGMDWEEYFQRLFRTPHHIVGLGIPHLEGGETYEVWDLVTLPDRQTPYAGYSNDERQMVVIPE